MPDSTPQPVPQVQKHVDALRDAGLDTDKFFEALTEIRDDRTLSTLQKDALCKLIAMESFIWYMEALRNEPVDRAKLQEEVARIAEHMAKSGQSENPGDRAAALANANISTKKKKKNKTEK